MAWDTALAREIRAGRRQTGPPGWYEAVCAQVAPPVFTIADGSFRFETGKGLTMTAMAQAVEWQTGRKAAAILAGGSLLVIDAI